ncbi:MAG: HK97 gp10 family phage protein [Fusobacteriaceae bacterium]
MGISRFERSLKGRGNIQGLDHLLGDLEKIIKEFPNEVNKVTNTIGSSLKGHIVKLVPVDTGELRTSLVFRSTGNYEVTVGTTKEYAGHVNYGTRRRGGVYFLERGIQNFEDNDLEPLLEHCIKKVLKK